MSNETAMNFFGHLAELRRRLFRAFIGLLFGFAVAYYFSKELFTLLRIPFDTAYQNVYGMEPNLIVSSLLESFMVYLKVGLLGGLFLSSPFIFLQVWGFISPALKANEKKHVLPFVFFATLFFVFGALFGYFMVFPQSFEYFLNITKGEHIDTMIRMDEYYQFASWMLLGFGLAFEAPLIVLYLVFFRILSTRHLIRYWRGVIIGILIASAIITPTPDFATMFMMAAPLLVLYGATIVVSLFIYRGNSRPVDETVE